MSKAQGLPLTTIVIAVISFLVLFTVIVFFTGGFSKIFGQARAATNAVDADVSAAQTKCSQWCLQAQNLDSTAQRGAAYCVRTQPIDANGDGKNGGTKCTGDATGTINCAPDGTREILKCQQSPISFSCSGVSCT